jgi:hypothetical protein
MKSEKHIYHKKNIFFSKKINSRQKLFAQILISEGWHKAREITKYSRVTIWRLMNNQEFKEYLKETSDELSIQYQDVVKGMWDIAIDENAPATVRSRILKYLMERLEDEFDDNEQKRKSINSTPLAKLLPSKDL